MEIVQNAVFLILGAIIGWLTNFFFYQKADRKAWLAAHPLEQRTDDILSMLLHNRLEARWGSSFKDRVEHTAIPADANIPHILRFHVTNLRPKQGETVGILFRIVDTGMDFWGHMEVTEVSSKVHLPTLREGHGYYSCQVTFPKNLILGLYKVEFKLIDSGGRQHHQFLEFDVVSQ